MDETASTTYHVTWQSIGLLLKLALLVFVPLEITCAILFLVFLAPLFFKQLTDSSFLGLAAFSTLGVMIPTILAVIIIYKTGTFLRLSPEGLEYHRWPFTTISCRWGEVEKIAQGNVMGISAATLMIPREKIGWEMPVQGGVLGSGKYKLVPLQDFQGWPDGELMND